MKTTKITARLLAGALLCTVAQLACADWKYYEAKSYGFSMWFPKAPR